MKPAEHLARRFHETYERLAPLYGYTTREETREFDPTSPNGRLMIAVCEDITADAGMAHAARVLAEFAKTAPGRLPQRVYDAIEVALAEEPVKEAVPSRTFTDSAGERWSFDPACAICHGRGTFIAAYSGREDDGNAPIWEDCDCFLPASSTDTHGVPELRPFAHCDCPDCDAAGVGEPK